MNLRISSLLERLRSSLFFVPMVAVIVATVLGLAALAVDRRVDTTLADLPLGFTSTVESARTLLGVIAGATISFAGIAFSVSLLIIQLASSQYSPRVVHTLFRDPFNKRVMALVVGTFTYCVVVLRSVRSALEFGGDPVIPNISVAIAVVLGIATILAIVAFINHSAHAMDISEILERIRRETTEQIRAEWTPTKPGVDTDHEIPPPSAEPTTVIRADRSGWIQADRPRRHPRPPTSGHHRPRRNRRRPLRDRRHSDSSASHQPIDADDLPSAVRGRLRDREHPHDGTRRHVRSPATRRHRRQSTLAGHQRPHHGPRRHLPHRSRPVRTAPPRPAASRDDRRLPTPTPGDGTAAVAPRTGTARLRRDTPSRRRTSHRLPLPARHARVPGRNPRMRRAWGRRTPELDRQARLVAEGCGQSTPLGDDIESVKDAYARKFTRRDP
jgi:hypothetical protein